jgi:hypothetical protein
LAMSSFMRSGMREAFSMNPSITATVARHRNGGPMQLFRVDMRMYLCSDKW